MVDFLSSASLLLSYSFIAAVLSGTLLGIVVGVLPGLSGSTTAALLLPITVMLDPISSVAFLGAVYCAANFGGSITAILINAPGDPSAAATAYDGYPMAKRGEAGRAIGMSAVASTIGGIFSVFVMILAAPLLSRAAYQFGAPEYFALAVFGLSMVAAVGGRSGLKNLIAGCFGVLLATVGLDLTTGVERFTFGSYELSEGVQLVPVLIGLFAIAELLTQSTMLHQKLERIRFDRVDLPTIADFRKAGKSIAFSTVLGTAIGILPALGSTTAALIAYAETKRWSKYKHEFGHGAIEGVAGPEAANNAAVGGAMVPTLALGIPGSAMTAVILAGMIVQGVRPGPQLFVEQPQFLYAVFYSMLAANILYLVLGFGFAKIFARVALIRESLLWPIVLVLSIVGAYGNNQSFLDVWVMLLFGIIGFLMNRGGFSPAPLVIGLVLGTMLETSLKQSLIIFDQQWWLFFSRPIVVVFFVLTLAGLFAAPLLKWVRAVSRRRGGSVAGAPLA